MGVKRGWHAVPDNLSLEEWIGCLNGAGCSSKSAGKTEAGNFPLCGKWRAETGFLLRIGNLEGWDLARGCVGLRGAGIETAGLQFDGREFGHQRPNPSRAPYHIRGGSFELHAQGIGQNGGDHRRLMGVEFRGPFVVDTAGGRFHAIHVFPGFDHVEVDLHDAMFAP